MVRSTTTGTLISKVSYFRNAHSVTQETLADAIGVSRQTISAIEKGNYTPSVLLALALANYFNTSVEKLFIYEK